MFGNVGQRHFVHFLTRSIQRNVTIPVPWLPCVVEGVLTMFVKTRLRLKLTMAAILVVVGSSASANADSSQPPALRLGTVIQSSTDGCLDLIGDKTMAWGFCLPSSATVEDALGDGHLPLSGVRFSPAGDVEIRGSGQMDLIDDGVLGQLTLVFRF